ncbi:phage portal protein [Salipaludibacillus aurantiacus]|uniref:phage portal protein n=1 Tax=Salipaludibacillus aurantiacus TaxID=1601833 RepID=UPI003183D09B
MGLLKGIKGLRHHKQIEIDEMFFNRIDYWDRLYRGFPESGEHEIKYTTVDGKQNKRRKMSLNLPKVVAQEMASLVYNEKVEINIGENETLEKLFEEIKKDNKFNKNIQDHLEYNFALGGFVIKPYVKDDKIKLSYVTAKSFIPLSWGNTGVTEAVFPNQFKRQKYWYTHLEWHVWEGNNYVIKNTLHRSDTQSELGIEVPLTDVYENLEPEIRFRNFKKQSMFVHIKPNIANNFDIHSPLGISLYANATDTINTLDTMFDSFNREFRLGKKRIIVPAHMVKSVVGADGGMHRYFDPNDETYEAFDFGQDADDIKDINVVLRVEEHIAAINAMLNLLASQIGFSAGAFTFDGEGVKTATEVVSENSKTFKSKQSHEIIIEEALTELIDIIVYLSQTFGSLPTVSGEYQTSIHFDDSIAEDRTAEAERIYQDLQNKIIPKKRAIMKRYGLTEDEAKEWLAEINEENATATADSLDFFGGSGN